MPLKLAAPLEKIFTLDRTDRIFSNDGEPTTVTVRQATQSSNEIRGDVYAKVERSVDDKGEVILASEWSAERLKRTEVYLTMVDCNILDENGDLLFKFKKDGSGRQILDMTTESFRRAWGKLDPIVAAEIHEKVLEVNLSWAGPLES